MFHHEIPELDTKGLRQFGLILGGVLAAIFGLLLPWRWHWLDLPNWYWIASGALVVLWALLAPGSLRTLYRGWMHVALIIGAIVNAFVLAIVFFLLITPMGFVGKLMGKDPMRRRLDPALKSYRVESKIPNSQHMERIY